jgi:hypothetical protein
MVFQKLALIALAVASFASATPIAGFARRALPVADFPGFNRANCTYVFEPSVTPVVSLPRESLDGEISYSKYASSEMYCSPNSLS